MRAGTLTSRRSESGPSSRTAMIEPPMIVMGAATKSVQTMTTSVCTCVTSLVMRVMSDRRPERGDVLGREVGDPVEQRAAHVASEGHGGAGAEVDGGDREARLHERDGEHQAAGPPDVVGVAGDDALVDDVGVEGREVERAHHLHERERHHDRQQPAVAQQVGAEQSEQIHQRDVLSVVAAEPVEQQRHDLLRGQGLLGRERRVRAREREAAQQVRGLHGVAPERGAVGFEHGGERAHVGGRPLVEDADGGAELQHVGHAPAQDLDRGDEAGRRGGGRRRSRRTARRPWWCRARPRRPRR